MDIEVEPAADDGHTAGMAVAETASSRAPSLGGGQGARVDPEDGAAPVMIPGQEIAETVR
jgi:hypothetical protein